jgi:hypothetical protein
VRQARRHARPPGTNLVAQQSSAQVGRSSQLRTGTRQKKKKKERKRKTSSATATRSFQTATSSSRRERANANEENSTKKTTAYGAIVVILVLVVTHCNNHISTLQNTLASNNRPYSFRNNSDRTVPLSFIRSQGDDVIVKVAAYCLALRTVLACNELVVVIDPARAAGLAVNARAALNATVGALVGARRP